MSFMHKCWGALYKLTPAEYALEPAVASLGVRYRTQFPLWLWHNVSLPYFLDFALLDYRVAIEVDDPGHMKPSQMRKDKERSRRLLDHGWRVVRCSNEDSLHNPVATVNRLMIQAGLLCRATVPDHICRAQTTHLSGDPTRATTHVPCDLCGSATPLVSSVTDRYGPANGSARSPAARASGARRGTRRPST